MVLSTQVNCAYLQLNYAMGLQGIQAHCNGLRLDNCHLQVVVL
jgi:hypothetical protein